MDTICTQCGAKLPRVIARYCNNCGALVSSNSFSPPSSSTKDMASSPARNEQPYSSRPPLREQIAQQPPSRPVRRPSSDEAPAWIHQLERGTPGRTPSDPLRMKRTMDATKEQSQERFPTTPPANRQQNQQTPVPAHRQQAAGDIPAVGSIVDAPVFSQALTQEKDGKIAPASSQQDMADKPTQASVPAAPAAVRPVSSAPARELRVKVWPQEENALAGVTPPAAVSQSNEVDDTVEDLPTRPLAAPARPPVQQVATAQPGSQRRDVTTGEIEHMSTVPLLAQAPVTPPSRPIVQPQAWPQSQPGRSYIQGPISQVPPVASAQGVVQHPISPIPSVSSVAPLQERTQSPPVAPEPAIRRRAKSGRRVPALFGLVALVVLAVGALGAWIVIRQPFTVPASTQPQQTFTSTQLGMSVLYPSGWTAKVDQSKDTVSFSDSSHTGQVNVMVAPASGDVTAYLTGEAKKLGMTGVKQGAPLSFAGTSWQALQGNVQQSGANYTCELLATVHDGHIYTIVQMAPQAVYSQEDQLVFSHLRSSFHFLT